MSLAALNSPPLVAAAGVGLHAIQPLLERVVAAQAPISFYKAANILSFAIQLIAVSRPGRIDGQTQQSETSDTNKKDDDAAVKEMDSLSPGRNGKTLVSPSGWAFAIWAPIFSGELIFSITQLFITESSPVAPLLKIVTVPFVTAQSFQTLWCAAFRPKYSGNLMYISTFLLGSTAYCLGQAHSAIAASPKAYSPWQYAAMFLPISLHFGWTSAATLVNLNGAVAMRDAASPKVVRWLGHMSVIAATAAGVYISLSRSAPVYGGVISWALFAVSDGMKTRVKKTEKEDENRLGVFGASMQMWLSKVGAWATASASLAASISLYVL